MSAETLTTLLGWCTAINFGMLIVSTVVLYLGRSRITPLHARMFGIDEAALPIVYFQYLGYYKLIILTLNLTPYIAMKLITAAG